VLGAVLVIRRSAFESVGGFDESYFMFSEEVDLCYRLKKAGWEVHFTPAVTVVHVEGASTKENYTEMELLRYSGTQRFYQNHYSRFQMAQLRMLTTYCHAEEYLPGLPEVNLARSETNNGSQ
jgi:N-acetylglucosaminyl-diphospho-decaprenol L-rhamnosyltransferase